MWCRPRFLEDVALHLFYLPTVSTHSTMSINNQLYLQTSIKHIFTYLHFHHIVCNLSKKMTIVVKIIVDFIQKAETLICSFLLLFSCFDLFDFFQNLRIFNICSCNCSFFLLFQFFSFLSSPFSSFLSLFSF